MIELRTLGALELAPRGDPPRDAILAQPRRSALLCYLALARPHGFHRRDTLYGLFWPEQDAEQARHALRQSLYVLRHALGAEAIVSLGEGLALNPDHVACDAVAFEQAVEQGRLAAGLALYRGELLPGFHISGAPGFERWLDAERQYLAERAAEAALSLAELREREGDPRGATVWGRRALALAPADETALRRVLLLLDRVGDRAAASRVYDAFARQLEKEYELPPSRETRALRDRLRMGRSDDVAERAAAAQKPACTVAEASLGLDADSDTPVIEERPSGQSEQAAVSVATPVTAPRSAPASGDRVWGSVRNARLGAGVLLALLASVIWWLAARPGSGEMVRERVIVGHFASLTSDSTIGDLVAHVLGAELARSPVLNVVGQARVAETLRRMRLPPGTQLRAELAREMAVREEVKVIVEGEVRTVGTALMLRASVVEAASGEIVHGVAEMLPDSTALLPAIARVSNEIRRAVGESVASVRAGDSLWSFTTSSLGALRKHMAATRAFRQGDYRGAIHLLEEAVALDPEFAHAHLLLFGLLDRLGFPRGRHLPHLIRAHELSGRLTDRERYAIEGIYHREVAGDLLKAIGAFRRHLEALRELPSDEGGWYTSFASTLVQSGDLAGAERVLQEARARYPIAINLALLVEVLHALGREREARQVLDEARRRYPAHPDITLVAARVLAAAGRLHDGHALAERLQDELTLESGLRLQAELDVRRGRLSEAIGHYMELRDQLLARENPAVALEVAVAAAQLRLAAGDSSGTRDVEALLARVPVDSLDALSRPYLALALLYARLGRAQEARAWLTAYEQNHPSHLRGVDARALHRARAAVWIAEERPTEALQALRHAARFPAQRRGELVDPFLPASAHPELARVYERLGATDSAVAVCERYLAARSLRRSATDAVELPEALERLARLYERRGHPSKAAAFRRRIVVR